MELSWCDKLASTPAVGIRLERHFDSSGSILNCLSPLLGRWVKDDKETFSLTKQGPFSVELMTEEGYQYGIEPGRIFIDFRHRLKVRQNSGAFPTVELISRAEPFTSLLPEAFIRLTEVTKLLAPRADRKFDRIGVVSTTQVEEVDAPPGIQKMIKYCRAPWPMGVPVFHFEVLGIIDKNERWTDKCQYQVILAENENNLITLKFDWHREYAEFRSLTELDESIRHAEKSALSYFEEVALGNRFNVNKPIGKD